MSEGSSTKCVGFMSRKHSHMTTPERRRFKTLPGHFVSRRSRASASQRIQVSAAGTERNDGRIWGDQGNPSQQAAESSAGVLDKLICHSDAGQFCERSALERNEMQRKISGVNKSWPVSRLLLASSATGNASRRYSSAGRTKSRGLPVFTGAHDW